MNDDFLYQLRPTPSKKFTAELKAKLDRQSAHAASRRSRFGRLIVASFLVGGVAFAVAVFYGQRRIDDVIADQSRAPTPTLTSEVRVAPSPRATTDSAIRIERATPKATTTPPQVLPRQNSVTTATAVNENRESMVERQRVETYQSNFIPAVATERNIYGAGSTYVYPLLAKWAGTYQRSAGVGLNYQSISSGGGIKQLKARAVIFAATDKALEPSELKESELMQFPIVVSGLVPVINVKGISRGQLVLDGPTLAGIYLNEIRTWSDARIKKLNPTLVLPNTPIVPIYRSDAPAVNYLFTSFLSKSSSTFAARVGVYTAVPWPLGLGAKGNEGAANMARQIEGAIAYVEYAYVNQADGLVYTSLVNRAGNIVTPSVDTLQAAAMDDEWLSAPFFSGTPINQPGEHSWPITGVSYLLMHVQPHYSPMHTDALNFFDWGFASGGQMAIDLQYVPLPKKLIARIHAAWQENVDAEPAPASN